MAKALDTLLTIPDFADASVSSTKANYFSVEQSSSVRELAEKSLVVTGVVSALAEQRAEAEKIAQIASQRANEDSLLREVKSFGATAAQVPGIFTKINKLENAELKTTLQAKLMATFLVSLDTPKSFNQKNFLQAYLANQSGLLGMFKRSFSDNHNGKSIADIIIPDIS